MLDQGVIITFLLVTSCASQIVDVNTQSGPLRGRLRDVPDGSGRRVHEFLGIPFAEPPLGELRFLPPRPVKPWTTLQLATGLPNTCYQEVMEDVGIFAEAFKNPTPLSEDCLYLNIWTPNPRPQNAAVMVWIHGGGFTSGYAASNDTYDGKILASHNNVVVVNIQYRLGALGFLSFGTASAPGNVGLLDQQLAIKWVKDNIESFGGDPERITLFGESAGGASVSFHLLSRDSRRYFTRGIMQSGTYNAPWALNSQDVATQAALALAKYSGCPSDQQNLQAIMSCLRQMDASTIVDIAANIPTITPVDGDKNFLANNVKYIMDNATFYKTDILLGTTLNEGSMFLLFYANEYFPSAIAPPKPLNQSSFRSLVSILYPTLNTLQQTAIAYQYTNWSQPNSSQSLVSGIEQSMSDQWFLAPTADFAEYYVESGESVYMYQYLQMHSDLDFLANWTGVMHSVDIFSVFGTPLWADAPFSSSREQERDLARNVMEYWSNFAKTGNPNEGSSGAPAAGGVWPRRTENREYLKLVGGVNPMQVGEGPRSHYCAFWKHYIPSLATAKTESQAKEYCDSKEEDAQNSSCIITHINFNTLIILAISVLLAKPV